MSSSLGFAFLATDLGERGERVDTMASAGKDNVQLALEIAALPKPQQSGGAAGEEHDPFAPRPRLDDILPHELGGAIYATAEQLYPSLAQRLHRLWHDRGDFSKFKRSALNPQQQPAEPQPPLFGIPSPEPSLPSSPAHEGGAHSKQEHGKAVSISVQDAESLKNSMLQRIGNAHFATYFLHNLVALLLQYQTSQRKSQLEQQSALAQSQVQILSSSQQQQQQQNTSRTESTPEPSTSGPAQQHQEPYFDPKILGLSEVFPDPSSSSQNQQQNASHNIDDDEEEEQRKEDNPQQQEQERDQPVSDEPNIPLDQTAFPALATTRATLLRTSSILRSGSLSIRRVAGSSPSTSTSEQTRWAGLAALKTSSSASWKLAPAPQNVGVGSAVWWGGLSAREDGEGAGAKDAWVGYGLPEVQPRFRRNAMAYFADEETSTPSATSIPSNPPSAGTGPLVFLRRPGRRLRLRLISPDGIEHVGDSDARRKRLGEELMEGGKAAGIENALREAQEELLDEELWSSLLAQVQNTSAIVIRSSSSQPSLTKPPQSSAGGTSTVLSTTTTPVSTPAPQLPPPDALVVGVEDERADGKDRKRKRRRFGAMDALAALSETEKIEVRLGGGWKLVLEMGRKELSASIPSDRQEGSEPTSPSSALPRILLAYLRLSLLRSIRLRLRARDASSSAAAAAAAAATSSTTATASATASSNSKTGASADRGKSQAQLEREAAAASSKRGVGAYELSGSKLKQQQQQQQQQAAASVVGEKADVGKEKEKGLGRGTNRESYLDPVLGLFRYATFIADVELVLDALSRRGADADADGEQTSTSERREGKKGSRIWYRLSPLASLVDTSAWLRILLDESPQSGGAGMAPPQHASASASGSTTAATTAAIQSHQMDAVRILSGVGTVFCDDSPLVLINFGYPARLSVQFTRREMVPRWTGELSLDVFRKFMEREVAGALG